MAETDHGLIYCFRALSRAGSYSYASQVASYTPPAVVSDPATDSGVTVPDPADPIDPEADEDRDWLPIIYIASGVAVLVIAVCLMYFGKTNQPRLKVD